MDKNYMESLGITVDEQNIQPNNEIERIGIRQENHYNQKLNGVLERFSDYWNSNFSFLCTYKIIK